MNSIATEIQILNSRLYSDQCSTRLKRANPTRCPAQCVSELGQIAITAAEEKGMVLNVQFRDTDKALVLPITRMISEA